MERTGKINGTIDANPNPVLFGQGNVVIWWETNDPTGGEVRVSTSAGDEKLVARARDNRDEQKSHGLSVRRSTIFVFVPQAKQTRLLIP